MADADATTAKVPWNKGKLVGQKAPLKLKDIWAIRIRLQLGHRLDNGAALPWSPVASWCWRSSGGYCRVLLRLKWEGVLTTVSRLSSFERRCCVS